MDAVDGVEDVVRPWVWTWSFDEESWPVGDRRYGTREEAIAAGRRGDGADEDWAPGYGFFVGRWRKARASDFVSRYLSDQLLESMGNEACEELGDCVNGWPPERGAAADDFHVRLKGCLDAWANVHGCHPTFGPVEGVEWIEGEIHHRGTEGAEKS